MSRQFQEADQLRDQLSSLGVMVHDREKTWEVKPGFGGAPAPQTPARGQPLSTCSGVRFRESVSTWHSSQTFCPA